MTPIADVFPEILAPKKMVRKMSEKALFWTNLRQSTRQMGQNTFAI